MKRYEKLGLDLTTKEGFREALDICKRDYNKDGHCYYCENGTDCHGCAADYLFEEIKTKKVKRWETYNGNFMRAANDFKNKLCEEPIAASCITLYERFANWLMEEIEVEVKVESEDGFGLLM